MGKIMNHYKAILGVIGTILGIVVIMWGGFAYLSEEFASAGDLKQLAMNLEKQGIRLDQKIITDRIEDTQLMMLKFDIKYGPSCQQCPSVVKEEYERLRIRLKNSEKALDKLEIYDADSD